MFHEWLNIYNSMNMNHDDDDDDDDIVLLSNANDEGMSR